MSRFHLDPRVAPARPPPPAAIPPRASSVPPSPARPLPPAPAQEAPRTRRKAVVIGALVVALLLLGGAIAVYAATALGFPAKYVLDADERPAGMTNARLTASEMDQLGITQNPGIVDDERLADQFGDRREDGPEEGHVQVLTVAGGGGRIIVAALRYADEPAAQDGASEMRALCSFAGGAVLRDGDVVVALLPEDGASRGSVRAAALALQEKTPALRSICGL